jgi:hypothetical protein
MEYALGKENDGENGRGDHYDPDGVRIASVETGNRVAIELHNKPQQREG